MTNIQDKKLNRAAEWSFSFVQAGFWMSFCISVSFAAVYLQALGYSNSRLGVILALTTTTFGGMLASLIGGRMYDALSVTETLWAAFGIGLAGAVIVFLGTRRQ